MLLFHPLSGTEERVDVDELIAAEKKMGASTATGATTGLTRTPKEAIVVLLDVSGSMAGLAFPGSTDLGASMSRLDAVKQFFIAFANRSAGYDLPHVVGLLTFDNQLTLKCPITESWKTFVDSLADPQPQGATFLWDAGA